MCNYPEESNRGYEPLRIVERKASTDNVDEVKFNREPTFNEVNQMCSDEGMPIEDATVPVLSKETINEAVDAFVDNAKPEICMGVDYEAVNQLSKKSNRSDSAYCEEDSCSCDCDCECDCGCTDEPDEVSDTVDAVDEPTEVNDEGSEPEGKPDCDGNCDKCDNKCNRCDTECKSHKKFDMFDIRVDAAVKYLNDYIQVSTNTFEEFDRRVAECMLELSENELSAVCNRLPSVVDAMHRIELSKAEHAVNTACQTVDDAERKVMVDMVRNEENKNAPVEDKPQMSEHDSLYAFYDGLINAWKHLGDDQKSIVDTMPGFKSYRLSRQAMTEHEKFQKEINYDSDIMKEMAKSAIRNGTPVIDAIGKLDGDAEMINDAVFTSNAEYRDTTRAYNAAHQFNKSHAPDLNYVSDGMNINGCSETFLYGMAPKMDDIVKDGFGTGKDCRVSDIFESQLPQYERANKSMACVPPPPKKSPEESLIEMVSDMPKSMADKIIAISSDHWKFSYDGTQFTLIHDVMTRHIIITLDTSLLKDDGEGDDNKHLFSVSYFNYGLGEVKFSRHYDSLKELWTSGKNAKRVYDWFGKVISTFFMK